MTSSLLCFTQIPFGKEVFSKRKEFPRGSKFFPFRVDPFSEERGWGRNNLDIVVSPEGVPIALNS